MKDRRKGKDNVHQVMREEWAHSVRRTENGDLSHDFGIQDPLHC